MEIILKKDVTKLGYANDIVTVSNGYARNYLIPQGYAVLATATNKKIVAENVKQRAFKAAKLKTEAEDIAKSIEAVSVRIGAKAAQNGKIYGSVNALQIAEALKEQANIEVDRKKIIIDGESVKEVGEYVAKINLGKEVSASIKFEVYAE
ncbi:MAG: 50S ribosomal protein L9 [Bacteroidetes bacterium]|nr:50S ribosomal protein L9 [Bacteroidota bacterium]